MPGAEPRSQLCFYHLHPENQEGPQDSGATWLCSRTPSSSHIQDSGGTLLPRVPCGMTRTQASTSEPSSKVLSLTLSCPFGHECPQATKTETTHSPGSSRGKHQPAPRTPHTRTDSGIHRGAPHIQTRRRQVLMEGVHFCVH